ncbi:MAG: hypothetical protein Q9223_005840 [Gallowayella weberi]
MPSDDEQGRVKRPRTTHAAFNQDHQPNINHTNNQATKSTSTPLFDPGPYQAAVGSGMGTKRSANVMTDAYGYPSQSPKRRQMAPIHAQPSSSVGAQGPGSVPHSQTSQWHPRTLPQVNPVNPANRANGPRNNNREGRFRHELKMLKLKTEYHNQRALQMATQWEVERLRVYLGDAQV